MSPARLVLTALVLVACGKATPTNTTVLASSFDRSCQRSSDCYPVHEGDTHDCSPQMTCPNAAINENAAIDFNRAANDLAIPCQPVNPAGCSTSAVTCPAGQCDLRVFGDGGGPPAVSAADYSQSCTDVADCVAVYLGVPGCCDIPCPNAAISASDLPRYMTDLDHVTPVCFPRPPCAPPEACTNGRIACDNGACTLLLGSPDGGRD
jgi:hypothetical protein